MFQSRVRYVPLAAAVALPLAAFIGCEVIDQVVHMPTPSARRAEREEKEESMRRRFVVDDDSKAIRWLMANSIVEGMELEEVNRMLGKDGEFVISDNFVKTKSSGFRLEDKTYRWGPDDHGRAYFLVFRDRKLVNFEPAQYGRDE